MNIYLATWVQGGAFGLSAVVLAISEQEAMDELHLDQEDDSDLVVSEIGHTTSDEWSGPITVCRESL